MSHFTSKPLKPPKSIPPFSSSTPIRFILLHFIVTVTLFDSSSPVSSSPPLFSLSSSLIPCLCLPLCRLDPLWRQHSGYSSIANTLDLWMTTTHLYCHHMIVLYMRETQDTHAHTQTYTDTHRHTHTCYVRLLQACCYTYPSSCINKIYFVFFSVHLYLSAH